MALCRAISDGIACIIRTMD